MQPEQQVTQQRQQTYPPLSTPKLPPAAKAHFLLRVMTSQPFHNQHIVNLPPPVANRGIVGIVDKDEEASHVESDFEEWNQQQSNANDAQRERSDAAETAIGRAQAGRREDSRLQ